jgi:hypothetical protein
MIKYVERWNSRYVDLVLAVPMKECLRQLQSYTKVPHQYLHPFSPYSLKLRKIGYKHYKFLLRSSMYKKEQINFIAAFANGELQALDALHTTVHIRVTRFVWTDFFRWWMLIGGTLPALVFCTLAIRVFEMDDFKAIGLICLVFAYCCWVIYSQTKTATIMRDELLDTLIYYFEKLEDKYVLVSDY